ncbi:glycine zipper 2TM domain-containing protein [Humitalea sp. 24SJ18S-53]|uniref:glycine zipper 2TM domain-containing protein n=1 Tax=Humitalea sp. 24SJ18S-53 TaxID=3422307 RepID=UPI003D66CA78
MSRHPKFRALVQSAVVVLVAGIGLSACAPTNTGTTYSRSAIGQPSYVSYGTIVGQRPVQIAGSQSGVGAVAGAAAGGVAGSFIGGDWRSQALMGIGGAIVGGLAGNAIESGVTRGSAMEFVVREDRGGDIAVVQTNEDGLQVGDRVVVNRGQQTRLSRAAGGPAINQGAGFAAPMGAVVK